MTTKPKKPRTKALTSSERVRLYRAKKKKAGMRLLQIWVPDTRSPKVKVELRRQARLLAKAPDHEEVMRFLESHYEDWDK
jgi:Protein  of unknown function (DUF3018)